MKVPITVHWLSEHNLLIAALQIKALKYVEASETAEGFTAATDLPGSHLVLENGDTIDPDDPVVETKIRWDDSLMFCPHELSALGFDCSDSTVEDLRDRQYRRLACPE